ncbi:MAG: hypothetical protein QM642_03335 [Edaphocola sp.]
MKTISFLSVVALLAAAAHSFGQSGLQPVKMSFGDKYSGGYEGVITDEDKWAIYSIDEHEQLANGTGSAYADFVFQKPGNYRITFEAHHDSGVAETTHTCEHKLLPDTVLVAVSGVRMNYDFSNINFSAPIHAGVPANSISVSVPVQVELYGDNGYTFTIPAAKTAGLATSVVAEPTGTSPVVLQNGTMTLNYQLSGSVSRSSYIMFDFVDFNGNVQSYAPTSIID